MRSSLFAPVAAVAVACVTMAGAALAQQPQTPQQKAIDLAKQIQARIAALGPNASAADIQAAINATVAGSGYTPAEALAAIQAVAQSNPASTAIQTAATNSGAVVMQSAGDAQAQAQIRVEASALTNQAAQQLASTAKTGAGTSNNSPGAQQAQNNGNNIVASNSNVVGSPGVAVGSPLGATSTPGAPLAGSSYR